MGELEKRLKKVTPFSYKSTEYDYKEIHEILKIIEEARREFPYFNDEEKRMMHNSPHDYAVFNAIENALNERREKWFMKWFDEEVAE